MEKVIMKDLVRIIGLLLINLCGIPENALIAIPFSKGYNRNGLGTCIGNELRKDSNQLLLTPIRGEILPPSGGCSMRSIERVKEEKPRRISSYHQASCRSVKVKYHNQVVMGNS